LQFPNDNSDRWMEGEILRLHPTFPLDRATEWVEQFSSLSEALRPPTFDIINDPGTVDVADKVVVDGVIYVKDDGKGEDEGENDPSKDEEDPNDSDDGPSGPREENDAPDSESPLSASDDEEELVNKGDVVALVPLATTKVLTEVEAKPKVPNSKPVSIVPCRPSKTYVAMQRAKGGKDKKVVQNKAKREFLKRARAKRAPTLAKK